MDLKEEYRKIIKYMLAFDASSDLIENYVDTFILINEEYKKQLTLTDVGCSFSIGFAQYIAKEHYTLVNQIGEIHYWRNEEFSKTTEQLLKDYKKTLT